tara:strand:- start:2453 stop:2611 length:159 start_codon:yes stop_codon:yes gene_type:complete
MSRRDMIALLVIILWVILNLLILRFFSVCDVDKHIKSGENNASLDASDFQTL